MDRTFAISFSYWERRRYTYGNCIVSRIDWGRHSRGPKIRIELLLSAFELLGVEMIYVRELYHWTELL